MPKVIKKKDNPLVLKVPEPKSPFRKSSYLQERYASSLRGVVREVAKLIKGYNPINQSQVMKLKRALFSYAEIIAPWATRLAEKILNDVNSQDLAAWRAHSKKMSQELKKEIFTTPVGDELQKLLRQQVELIKSVPLKAAEDIQDVVIQGLTEGWRTEELKERILNIENVTRNRVNVIARTEIARASTNLTRVRAVRVGSEGYIWRTVGDAIVRPSHRAMEGKFVKWDNPPLINEGTAKKSNFIAHHAGEIFNCYDNETEVLTDEGYRKFDVLSNELVATMNPDTRELEYLAPKSYIKKRFKGIMLHLKTKTLDVRVTPNHDLVFEKEGVIRKITAEEFKNKRGRCLEVPRQVKWCGDKSPTIKIAGKNYDTDKFMSFLGWFLSDGSVSLKKSSGKYRWQIAVGQNPGEKFDEIKFLISSLFKKFWIGKDRVTIVGEDNLAEYLKGLGPSYEKHIPKELKGLSSEYLRRFLISFCKGDGSLYRGKKESHQDTNVYTTSSSKLADDIAELIIKVGKSPTFVNPKKEAYGKEIQFRNGIYKIQHPCFYVFENNSKHKFLRRERVFEENYDDYVYCVEMPKNKIINVRRNGKVTWCGNCRCWPEVTLPGGV